MRPCSCPSLRLCDSMAGESPFCRYESPQPGRPRSRTTHSTKPAPQAHERTALYSHVERRKPMFVGEFLRIFPGKGCGNLLRASICRLIVPQAGPRDRAYRAMRYRSARTDRCSLDIALSPARPCPDARCGRPSTAASKTVPGPSSPVCDMDPRRAPFTSCHSQRRLKNERMNRS